MLQWVHLTFSYSHTCF